MLRYKFAFTEKEDFILFIGPVSDKKIAALLFRARLLAQPFLYEGFCLPRLEAMVMGTKALISDIPVFREIYDGFPVAYFRAGDKNDLKEKFKYTFEKTASIILGELS